MGIAVECTPAARMLAGRSPFKTPPMKTSPGPRAPLALRLLGGLVLLGLMFVLTLWNLAALALPGPWDWLPQALLGVVLVLAVIALWKKIRLFESVPSVAAGAIVLAAALTYLAWDDPAYTHPLTMDELVPPPERDAAASHASTLAFTRQGDQPAPRPIPVSRLHLRRLPTADLAAWREEIGAKRAEVAAELAALEPAQAWLRELDAFADLGDEPKPDLDTLLPNVALLRQVTDVLCAQAALVAAEGRGDEAFALLRPVVGVSLKLERHGRSVLRLMIASRNLAQALAVLNHVVQVAPVSPSVRSEFAALLAPRDAALLGRRLAWLEYVMFREVILHRPARELIALGMDAPQDVLLLRVIAWSRPFTLLPRETANLMARLAGSAERLFNEPGYAEHYRPADHDAEVRRAYTPKNFGGRALVLLAWPNYVSLAERQRSVEQRRLALLEALRSR